MFLIFMACGFVSSLWGDLGDCARVEVLFYGGQPYFGDTKPENTNVLLVLRLNV